MQQPLEEALGRAGVSPILHKDVEHHPVLVDGAPEIMQRATNAQEDLVEVPGVARPRPSPPQPGCEVLPELQAPPPNALVRDRDASLGQNQLDITQAQAEDMVQPNGMVDDLGLEAVPRVGLELRRHCASFAHRPREATGHQWDNAGAGEGLKRPPAGQKEGRALVEQRPKLGRTWETATQSGTAATLARAAGFRQ
jgi:hypothetical protein